MVVGCEARWLLGVKHMVVRCEARGHGWEWASCVRAHAHTRTPVHSDGRVNTMHMRAHHAHARTPCTCAHHAHGQASAHCLHRHSHTCTRLHAPSHLHTPARSFTPAHACTLLHTSGQVGVGRLRPLGARRRRGTGYRRRRQVERQGLRALVRFVSTQRRVEHPLAPRLLVAGSPWPPGPWTPCPCSPATRRR